MLKLHSGEINTKIRSATRGLRSDTGTPPSGGHGSATLLALLFGLPALGLSSAHAQTPPDAGSLLRESERALQAPRSVERPVVAPAARPMADNAKAARVTVKRIVIDGATLITAAELDALVADRIGQSLTLAELEQAAQRIAAYYRERGWYVRVYLPRQDVTDGTVHIQILEGRYGGSRLENKGHRANGAYVQGVVTHRLTEGEPLSAADLERGLLLANDLPGIRTTGLLDAGQAQGQTRLDLVVDDAPFVSGDIGINNQGVKSTGTNQVTGGIALNNLSGRGDQLALRALAAENIYSGLLRYSLPLGSDGLRLAAHASTLGYRLGGRYKPLDAEGSAFTSGLTLSYPLIRQSEANLNVSAGYEYRSYDDDMLHAALRRHQINAFTLGLSGDRRDGLLGGGANWGSLQLTQGSLAIRNVADDRTVDAAGPRTDGSYSKLAFSANRLQALGTGGWQVLAAFSGQLASGNLGSSERFTLGGPTQVRAYPVNEASGDEGLLFKLELQRELGNGWQAIAFYDTGRIRQHKDTWAGWQGGGRQPNDYDLSGVGLGTNWRGQGSLSGWLLAASAAVPVGSNPGRDASGHNSDGSSTASARYWLSLTKVF